MQRQIITTLDGSSTILIPEWDETYHSKNGAIQEAYHIFIQNGLAHFQGKSISILELGFGTGLNAFITLLEGIKKDITIDYIGLEKYPVTLSEVKFLNYTSQLNEIEHKAYLDKFHEISWEERHHVTPNFTLTKHKIDFSLLNSLNINGIDLVYFDAFTPNLQPYLWTEDTFRLLHQLMNKNSILVTYCAKGIVRRAMQKVGFEVNRLPGPIGKREMLQAIKK